MTAGRRNTKTPTGISGDLSPVLRSNSEGLFSSIPLTQGKIAIVDKEDYQKLNQHKWYAVKSSDGSIYYAAYWVGKKPKRKVIFMHRIIMNALPNQQIDHKNGNGLYNRKANLRFCTNSQNQQNRKSTLHRTSIFKGIFWNKWGQRRKRWKAEICLNHKHICIGYFNSEIEAAKAYDKKAKELFSEFARTNF